MKRIKNVLSPVNLTVLATARCGDDRAVGRIRLACPRRALSDRGLL
jgi:hypothetical protein